MSRATDAAAVDTAWATFQTAVQSWINNNGASSAVAARWIVGATKYIAPGCSRSIDRMVHADPQALSAVGARSFATNDTNN